MSFWQRLIVRRGHPRRIIIAFVGALWGLYFLWLHNWPSAVAIILGSMLLGELATLGLREEPLSQTLLGRIMLLHLHPANLLLQFAGGALLLYGVWLHSGRWLMAGVSMVFLGHLWGWHKVSDAL